MVEPSRGAWRRVSRAVLGWERQNQGGRPPVNRSISNANYRLEVGKLNAELTQGSSAACSIWEWDASASAFADTGRDETVYDWCLDTGETIASGKKVVLAKIREGVRVVVAAECPD